MRPQNRVVVEHFLYLCPLLGLSICTKYAEKNRKLKKKIVYSMALVFIYSVGRKHFCYYKRPLQSSFLINDQILQTSCFLFQLTQQLISMVIHQDSLFGY